jgi:sporulation protein YlmC with PRC-barrel domain
MPNNCNSIFNKFFVLLLSGLLFSCASIYPTSGSINEYRGKVMISSENYQNNSFNLKITSNESVTIIQVNKAFIGNVANIELNANKKAVSSYKIKSSFLDEALINYGPYFQETIFECLSGSNDPLKKLIKPKEIYINCLRKGNKTTFNIKYKNYEVKSFLESA